MFARALASPPHRRPKASVVVPPLEDLAEGVMRPLDIGQANTYKGLPLVLTDNGAPTVTAVSSKIVIVSVGMSNGHLESLKFIADAWPRNAQVYFVNCCNPTYTLEDWANPAQDANTWDRVSSLVVAAGHATNQIRVIWHKAAVQDPPQGRVPVYPTAGSYYESFLTEMAAFAARVATEIPSCQAVYTSTRTYGGWDTTGNHGEPESYEQGHALNTWLAANPSVDGVWYGWGPYLWANDVADGVNNGAGYSWAQSDFEADGVHPVTAGTAKVSAMLHARFSEDPWYPA